MEDKGMLQYMRQISESLGRVEANQANHLKYLDAVNGNVRENKRLLDVHISDTSAHGESSRSEVWGSIGKTLAVLGSVVTACYTIFQLVIHSR